MEGLMTEFLDRDEWTDTKSSSNGRWQTKVGIAVHYPAAGSARLGGLSKAQVAERLRGWRRLHTQTRGWADIGYNFAIDGSGRVWELRGFDNTGVHAAHRGYDPVANQKYLGVLFVIGNTEDPTKAAIEAFRDLRAEWLRRNPSATVVRGHGQIGPTQCPGKPLLALINSGALLKDPSGKPKPDPKPRPKPKPEVPAETADRLRRGSTGAAVSNYQRQMNRVFPLYSKLDVDGIYGAATERVTREFQRRSNLPQTGMVEDRERKALAKHGIKVSGGSSDKPSDPKPRPDKPKEDVLRSGSRGAKVTRYQKQLRSTFPAYRNTVSVRRGQLIDADGIYGAQTEAWTKEFQKRAGIKQTGVVDATTVRTLSRYGINL